MQWNRVGDEGKSTFPVRSVRMYPESPHTIK